ncbi:pH-response regulator protein palA/rim20 [Dissophora ornata]|nr:pH-response regulator protein palA/rim20 [Dissophora ornata]
MAIDFKKTEPLSMAKSLSDYISISYAEHPDSYQDDFRILDELRADIVNLEPHQNALNRLNAAGVFQHLRDTVIPELRITPTIDISTTALTVFMQLMLAQAQECFWQKGALDKIKDGLAAKLAAKVAEFYEAANEGATHSSMSTLFTIVWTSQMQAKALHFNAVAQYRKACECISQNKYGEEIARLQIAERHVNSALDQQRNLKETVVSDLRSLQTAVHRNLSRAEKDNDIIYLEAIPAETALASIGKVDMCKPVITPEISDPVPLMNEHNMLLGVPLFSRLVPFAVHQAASVYSERKERIVKEDIIEKFDNLTGIYYSQLQAMNLPASLQALDRPVGLPPTLISHIDEIVAEGGTRSLLVQLETVQTLSTKNAAILDEVFEALQQEEEEDEAMRQRFQGRWNRPTSASLTTSFVEEGNRHMRTMETAKKSDQDVKRKLDMVLRDWGKPLGLLSSGRAEVERAVPSTTNAPGTFDPELVHLLQSLMEEGDGIIKARRIKMEEIKRLADEDDIGPALAAITNRLTANSSAVKIEPAHFEALFQEQLRKYDGYKRMIREEKATQDDLLNAIQETNTLFLAPRKSSDVVRQREQALGSLEAAYQKYKAVQSNLNEGIKFYQRLETVLVNLRNNFRDHYFARKMEAKDYMSQVTDDYSIMDLNGSQPQSPVRSNPSPYDAASAPPHSSLKQPQPSQPASGGWSPHMGLRFGGNTAGPVLTSPPASQNPNVPTSAFSPYNSPYGNPYSEEYATGGGGGAPQSYAQQLQQQLQQKQPASPSGQQQQQQQQRQQTGQRNTPPPSYQQPPSGGGNNGPAAGGWDPSKGLSFGGKPKN